MIRDKKYMELLSGLERIFIRDIVSSYFKDRELPKNSSIILRNMFLHFEIFENNPNHAVKRQVCQQFLYTKLNFRLENREYDIPIRHIDIGLIIQFMTAAIVNICVHTDIVPTQNHATIFAYLNDTFDRLWNTNFNEHKKNILNFEKQIIRRIKIEYEEERERLQAIEKSAKDKNSLMSRLPRIVLAQNIIGHFIPPSKIDVEEYTWMNIHTQANHVNKFFWDQLL
jgi:hypothetical protein